MAHPSREHFVAELELRLDRPATVVWDRGAGEWDTGRRALLAADPAATHHLVIQDDAIPCRDLVSGVEFAAVLAGEQPIGLYVGNDGPPSFAPLIERCLDTGAPWFRAGGPHWGVGVVIPTSHARQIVEAMDRRADVPNYDARIAKWYRKAGIEALYPMPSLLEHRAGPSLFANRSPERSAHRFVGAESSALELDWSRPPLTTPSHLTFRHRRTGRERTVEPDSERHLRLARNRLWELLDADVTD